MKLRGDNLWEILEGLKAYRTCADNLQNRSVGWLVNNLIGLKTKRHTYRAFGCRGVWLHFGGVRQWREQQKNNHRDERDDAWHVWLNWLELLWTNLTAKLIIGQRRGLSFIASRQLVSSKQELNSTDLECGKDSLLWAVRDRSLRCNTFNV